VNELGQVLGLGAAKRAAAPGKLVLTGAYAVLEGAPAIVVAVDRFAIADTARINADPPAEVCAALDGRPAPSIDVSALMENGKKLGLGSSAAALVASLGAMALARGEEIEAPTMRRLLFERARDAHAKAQRGGSGVDIAAAAYGGVLSYVKGRIPDRVLLPEGTIVRAYFSGTSARTTELRALVDRMGPQNHAKCMETLRVAALGAAAAIAKGDRELFIAAAMATELGLEELGRDADAPIVPPPFAELARIATEERAAFLPSGAGGGDVAVWIGGTVPSESFERHATERGMRRLEISITDRGLHAL
jgi:phosphomevalonate kinase